MSVDHQARIEKLRGRENYDTWKISAKSYLVIRGLWNHVLVELAATANEKERENDLKAQCEINLLIEKFNYSYIADCTSAKQVWDSLKSAFEDSGLCRKVDLLKQLVQTKLMDFDSTEKYVNSMLMTSIKVKNAGLILDDEIIASLLLAGLPDEYRPLVMAVENSTKKLTIDAVKTLLLQEVKNSSTSESALFNKHNLNKNTSTKYNKKVQCDYCKKFGHYSKL